MVILPTLLTVLVGVGLGIALGGSFERARTIRPDLWQLGAVAFALQVISQIAGFDGGFAVIVDLVSRAGLIAFALLNLRIGGMVVVVVGLALDFLVTLINRGMPTSRSALVSAGLVERDETGEILLGGARHVADGDLLAFLGEVIPLPTHQVVSIGDLLTLVGVVLVIMAVLRGRVLRRDAVPIDGERLLARLRR